MRTLLTAIPAALILILSGPVATTAVAADGALAPGKPMGIKQAQMLSTPLIIVGVVAVAAIGIGISSANSAPATSVVATSP
jgi:hypothetical protein